MIIAVCSKLKSLDDVAYLATGAESLGTQFGVCHGPVLRAIWGALG